MIGILDRPYPSFYQFHEQKFLDPWFEYIQYARARNGGAIIAGYSRMKCGSLVRNFDKWLRYLNVKDHY